MIDTKALRQKILDLAIRGKLVPQDSSDEPAVVLLERIREEKQKLVKEGKLKAKDIKNDSIIFVGEDNLHYEKFADDSGHTAQEFYTNRTLVQLMTRMLFGQLLNRMANLLKNI